MKGSWISLVLVFSSVGLAVIFPNPPVLLRPTPFPSDSQFFGVTVAVSGDGKTVVAGAEGNKTIPNPRSFGRAYVFTNNDGLGWSTGQELVAQFRLAYPNDDRFAAGDYGSSVTVSGDGNIIAIGAAWHGSNASGVFNQGDFASCSGCGTVVIKQTKSERCCFYFFTKGLVCWCCLCIYARECEFSLHFHCIRQT
jgi:hypothetical protein